MNNANSFSRIWKFNRTPETMERSHIEGEADFLQETTRKNIYIYNIHILILLRVYVKLLLLILFLFLFFFSEWQSVFFALTRHWHVVQGISEFSWHSDPVIFFTILKTRFSLILSLLFPREYLFLFDTRVLFSYSSSDHHEYDSVKKSRVQQQEKYIFTT